MIRPSDSLVGTHLNSVWLEATVLADPVTLPGTAPGAGGPCRFRVLTGRHQEPPELPSVFLVETRPDALEGFRTRLARGHRVRIIGRLRQHRWTDPLGRPREEVQIVGEWIEAGAPGL